MWFFGLFCVCSHSKDINTLPLYQVGAVLLKHLVDTAKVKAPLPGYTTLHGKDPPMAIVNAFTHGVMWMPHPKSRGKGKQRPVGVFRTHDSVVDMLTKTGVGRCINCCITHVTAACAVCPVVFISTYIIRIHPAQVPQVYLDSQLPMIIKPLPWTSVHTGGYFTTDLPVMRVRGDHLQLKRLLEADKETKVTTLSIHLSKEALFACLYCDYLWSIRCCRPLFDHMLTAHFVYRTAVACSRCTMRSMHWETRRGASTAGCLTSWSPCGKVERKGAWPICQTPMTTRCWSPCAHTFAWHSPEGDSCPLRCVIHVV